MLLSVWVEPSIEKLPVEKSVSTEIKCRYCWLNENELQPDNKLIKCCKCVDPICIVCLEKQANISLKKKCEICGEIYDYEPKIYAKSYIKKRVIICHGKSAYVHVY
jgi:hypothetical protein